MKTEKVGKGRNSNIENFMKKRERETEDDFLTTLKNLLGLGW